MATYSGGCLCGSVRYEFDADPIYSCFCHCRMCQRLSGAPVQASAGFPVSSFRLIRGELKGYWSSPKLERQSCAHCGSQLFIKEPAHPEFIDVWLTSLDDPNRISPTHHIWTASTPQWLELADDLPGFEGPRPEGWIQPKPTVR